MMKWNSLLSCFWFLIISLCFMSASLTATNLTSMNLNFSNYYSMSISPLYAKEEETTIHDLSESTKPNLKIPDNNTNCTTEDITDSTQLSKEHGKSRRSIPDSEISTLDLNSRPNKVSEPGRQPSNSVNDASSYSRRQSSISARSQESTYDSRQSSISTLTDPNQRNSGRFDPYDGQQPTETISNGLLATIITLIKCTC